MLQNDEDYSQRYVDKKINKFIEKIVLNLYKKGVSPKDIAEIAEVSLEFVENTLSNNFFFFGNIRLKNVEDYAQRKADEKINELNEKAVLNLNKEGLSLKDIAEGLDVSLEFVEKTLKNQS